VSGSTDSDSSSSPSSSSFPTDVECFCGLLSHVGPAPAHPPIRLPPGPSAARHFDLHSCSRADTDIAVYNLAHAPHNLLRLTRILKHLSEITPLQPHAAPLTLFFAAAHSEGLLNFTGGSHGVMAGDSLDKWWSGCFRDEAERTEVTDLVKARGGYGKRAWGFKEFDKWYEGRKAAGRVGWTGRGDS